MLNLFSLTSIRLRLRVSAILMGLLATLSGCGPTTLVIGLSPGDQKLTKTKVLDDGQPRSPQVAIIDLDGLIINANRRGLLRQGENPVAVMQEKLAAVAGDQAVVAIILRINSPGGTVTASDIIYREIQRFRENTNKPVISLMMDVAASGGYYVALAGDEIIAHPTTITGSVGVIIQTISVQPALSRLGVQTDAIKSGPNKDTGSPLSTMTAEQRATLQTMVDDFYDRFIERVTTNRLTIEPDQLTQATDGRVYSGTQALSLGMVDSLGDIHDAMERAMALAKVPTADLVTYHRPLEYTASPYAAMPGAPPSSNGTQFNVAQFNIDAGLFASLPAGAYYLWTMP